MAVAAGPSSVTSVVEIGEMVRAYPCPECADMVPIERLAVIQTTIEVMARPGEAGDPEYLQYARRQAANMLVRYLLDGNFIKMERGPVDGARLIFPLRATLGVVSTKQVATIEQRIVERQNEVAQALIEEASKDIRHWNSHYSGDGGSIHKATAIEALKHALTVVLERRDMMRDTKDQEFLYG
jgi:hypothetical protein